jgi:hypothetical protein
MVLSHERYNGQKAQQTKDGDKCLSWLSENSGKLDVWWAHRNDGMSMERPEAIHDCRFAVSVFKAVDRGECLS